MNHKQQTEKAAGIMEGKKRGGPGKTGWQRSKAPGPKSRCTKREIKTNNNGGRREKEGKKKDELEEKEEKMHKRKRGGANLTGKKCIRHGGARKLPRGEAPSTNEENKPFRKDN